MSEMRRPSGKFLPSDVLHNEGIRKGQEKYGSKKESKKPAKKKRDVYFGLVK